MMKIRRSAAALSCAVLSLMSVIALPAARAAGTEETPPSRPAPRDRDYEAGRAAIEARDWKKALDHFGRAAERDRNNADIHNWMGYAHRKSGNLDQAFRYYYEALLLNPRHLGAHEYVGEAYLMKNEPGRAEEHLARLVDLCGDCAETRELRKAIEDWRRARKQSGVKAP